MLNSFLDVWNSMTLFGKCLYAGVLGGLCCLLCAEGWLLVGLYRDLGEFKKHREYQDCGKSDNDPSQKNDSLGGFLLFFRKVDEKIGHVNRKIVLKLRRCYRTMFSRFTHSSENCVDFRIHISPRGLIVGPCSHHSMAQAKNLDSFGAAE